MWYNMFAENAVFVHYICAILQLYCLAGAEGKHTPAQSLSMHVSIYATQGHILRLHQHLLSAAQILSEPTKRVLLAWTTTLVLTVLAMQASMQARRWQHAHSLTQKGSLKT